MSKQDPAARRAAFFQAKAAEQRRLAAEQRKAAAIDEWQAQREQRWDLADFCRTLKAIDLQA